MLPPGVVNVYSADVVGGGGGGGGGPCGRVTPGVAVPNGAGPTTRTGVPLTTMTFDATTPLG